MKKQPSSSFDISFEILRGVSPLGDQFGVDSKDTVPRGLDRILFDEKKEGTPLHSGTNENQMPTYAILDAAKVVNLVETLENSGLSHRCLFEKDSTSNMMDVAPWIVKLEKDNELTRRLFTKGTAPWNLWGKGAGMYIRSNLSLDALTRHFSEMVKVKTDTNTSEYFRFWEAAVLDYIAFFGGKKLAEKIFNHMTIIWPSQYYHSGMAYVVGRIEKP